MSRTYRRKKGYRWFVERQTVSECAKGYRLYMPTQFDYKLIAKQERDKGNYTPSRNYKWDINKQRGACEKSELHKIMKSCRGDSIYSNDIYEYDDSYENTHQRHIRWIYW